MDEVTALGNSADVLKREVSNWGEHALKRGEVRQDKQGAYSLIRWR